MNTKIIMGVVGAVFIGAGSFFAGMSYAKSTSPVRGQFAAGQFAGRNIQGGARAGGFTSGQILSKDASGVTIKQTDGSTKIILFASSTQVMKNAPGSLEDLSVGTTVMITGQTNSDSSVTAQTVQIRPAGIPGSGTGGARPPTN